MRRSIGSVHPAILKQSQVPKDDEIVVDRPHVLSTSTHDIAYYEKALTKAFGESRRILRADGIAVIVFASKTTASWEAILQAVLEAGWTTTGSWPIDTEREARVSAQGQARLGSSVHLVCRPRVGSETGDWRDVLAELPQRMHEWMPRLVSENVVGADAIFACLGPAIEIFSRYSRVEKANGDPVPLKEYLEHVWAAVSKEAISTIFRDADAAGLEPDARLTAMWLWTIGGSAGKGTKNAESEDTEDDVGEEDESTKIIVKALGFALEFDAARKIAQGLGIHLEKSESIVEVKGDKARLLSVGERTPYLFGKEAKEPVEKPKRKKNVVPPALFENPKDAERARQLVLKQAKQPVEKIEKKAAPTLFDNPKEVEPVQETPADELKGPSPGSTVLDRLHQAMILFGAQRGELLKRFLVEEGVGKEARVWKLAQAFAALYPPGTDERRWVEGVLARKKSLGL